MKVVCWTSLGLWTRNAKPRAIKSTECKQADCHIEDISCIQHFDASHTLIWIADFCYKVVWKKYLSLAAISSLFPCVGFSTFNDVTYPLVTQTVITNGKLWSFYVYQLNTTLLHGEHTSNNPRHNLCWGTPELKLFEAIEDGKVIGKCDKISTL
jgi:hypothetical protein